MADVRSAESPGRVLSSLLRLTGIVDHALGFVCKGIVLLTIGALTAMLTLNVTARPIVEGFSLGRIACIDAVRSTGRSRRSA